MFCDQCHWYTRGEKICPHCGAVQKPPAPDAIFKLPKDISILDEKFMDGPLTDEPMPVIETSSPRAPAPKAAPAAPVQKPAPAPTPAPQAPKVRFCGRCGTMECIGAKYCAKCGAQLPQRK